MMQAWIALVAGGCAAGSAAALAIRAERTWWRARRTLEERAAATNRLLDFSQTIGGAGAPDQIFAALGHFLPESLGLSHVAILTHDASAIPPVQLKSAWPGTLAGQASSMDTGMCPCLRQSLPRRFDPNGAPVRCSIESCLSLPPDHPAYCIPLSVGRQYQCVIHMLLPPGKAWDERRIQLAQAYANAAHAALTSLQLLADAEKQSMTDALTALYNRRSMDQLLEREVALCERHGHALSVVMIDLDHFKQINDTHGHAAGDHLLKSFADCVRITLRKTDLAFRFGGDEFVIALPQTPLAQAEQVVQKLRQAFAAVDFSHAITHLDQPPTLSIGVAERSKQLNTLTLPSLLSAADLALYAAKNASRNCTRVYEPPKAA